MNPFENRKSGSGTTSSGSQSRKKMEENIIEKESNEVLLEKDRTQNRGWSWSNIWSWTWKPTSDHHLAEAEKRMLEMVGVTFDQKMIEIEKDVFINTIKVGNGPPLVLFHGFGAGIGLWLCNLKEFSENFTVYAIDLPGFGRSSRPPFLGNTVQQAEDYFLDKIEAWRKAVNLDHFTLLGHSFGAYLAALYSLRHPNVIDHVVLADPWGMPSYNPAIAPAKFPIYISWIARLLKNFNPLAILRAVGPYGPGLVTRFRKDLSKKFEHIYKDPSIVAHYIYHMNAQNPSGETAFSYLLGELGWAKFPIIERALDSLPQQISKHHLIMMPRI
eukprot:TRINITY_DN3169_c0_g1_i1.p1 TRINITY_DN3169_c0_g1~~TRINITY_DN3169_c0_g1_i1.p1  ORF type:complete len:329 (+),score=65.23 TRINITY_DN3169_c0_g1_i1:54-1040(+)